MSEESSPSTPIKKKGKDRLIPPQPGSTRELVPSSSSEVSPESPPPGIVLERLASLQERQERESRGSPEFPTPYQPKILNLRSGAKSAAIWQRKPKVRIIIPIPLSEEANNSFEKEPLSPLFTPEKEFPEEPQEVPLVVPFEEFHLRDSSSGESEESSPSSTSGGQQVGSFLSLLPPTLPQLPPLSFIPLPSTMSRNRVKYEEWSDKKGKDPDNYIREFEAKATTNGDEASKATIFGGLMLGNAQTWHSLLPNKVDWDVVKAAFLKNMEKMMNPLVLIPR
jgi:hypothetical protein